MSGRWADRLEGAVAQADWWLDGPLLKPIRKIAEALIVAAGPWVLAVVTLALIGRTAERWLAAEALEDIRLAVVYAFMIAPMVAAPLGIVAARLLTTTAKPTKDNSAVAALMLVTCGITGVTAQALSALVVFALGLSDAGLALAFVVLTSSSAMMWTAFIIMNAYQLRAYLLLSFAAGMGLTLTLCQVSIQISVSGPLLVWCFTAGIAFSFSLCLVPFRFMGLSSALVWQTVIQLRETLCVAWPFALGAFIAIVGIWADKWIAWAGPSGLVSAAGFVHSPTYDSPLFLAHLAAIPGLAALTLHFESPARHAMERFQNILAHGASLTAAEQAGEALSAKLWNGVHRTLLTQLALSGLLLLLAPLIATLIGLRLDQFLILRTALIGSLLHILFLSTSAILILCNRKEAFLILQFLFLATNVAGTVILSVSYGPTALGFTIASAFGSIAATLYAQATLREILKHCFINGNETLFRK
jgi:polysaccharide biosynthesis protein PelG